MNDQEKADTLLDALRIHYPGEKWQVRPPSPLNEGEPYRPQGEFIIRLDRGGKQYFRALHRDQIDRVGPGLDAFVAFVGAIGAELMHWMSRQT